MSLSGVSLSAAVSQRTQSAGRSGSVSRSSRAFPRERAKFFEKPVQSLGCHLVDVAVASAGNGRGSEECAAS